MVLTKVMGTKAAPPYPAALTVLLTASLPQVSEMFVSLFPKQNYGVRATGQQCTEAGDICAICQAEFREPLILLCQVRGAQVGPRGLRLGHSKAHDQISGLWLGSLGATLSRPEPVRPRFESQLFLLTADWLWAGDFPSLSLISLVKCRNAQFSMLSCENSLSVNPSSILHLHVTLLQPCMKGA